jgi:hypothetical protein
MDLPKPQAEYQPEIGEAMPVANMAETPAAIAAEKPGSPAPLNPVTTNPSSVSLSDITDMMGVMGTAAVSGTSMPAMADDTDLIEKEWVEKAKEIVAKTTHDPYVQNQEMNKVKAEYLKKRYNKDLKTEDS